MKKIIKIILIILAIAVIYYIKPIYTYVDMNIINSKTFSEEMSPKKDNYLLNVEQKYVKMADNFIVKNRQDILNVIFTSLNYGWDKVTFYCDESYAECYDDINTLLKENDDVSKINELVHPYHHYSKMIVNKNNMGKVTVVYELIYTKEMIQQTEQKISEIITELNLKPSNLDSNTTLIKAIHDYIINHANYSTDNDSDKTAYGLLHTGFGNCRGYTETMLILLNRLNIKTIPISNGHHVWNLVYNDSEWFHLDVTWDDPTSSDGQNILTDNYFMISTDRLETLDPSGDHVYDKEFFNEKYLFKIK